MAQRAKTDDIVRAMSTAQRIFVIYGTAILVVGMGLGTVLGLLRVKSSSIRNLATAHVETLMQSSMHFGLAFAIGLVGFDGNAATIAAWLLVIGSAMQAFGVTMNWIQNVGDQFAERSIGYLVNSSSTPVALAGLSIAVYGILTNL